MKILIALLAAGLVLLICCALLIQRYVAQRKKKLRDKYSLYDYELTNEGKSR